MSVGHRGTSQTPSQFATLSYITICLMAMGCLYLEGITCMLKWLGSLSCIRCNVALCLADAATLLGAHCTGSVCIGCMKLTNTEIVLCVCH